MQHLQKTAENRAGQKRQGRNPNLDLIRCVAVLCVVSVHFFLKAGFYKVDIIRGGVLLTATILRTGFMVCVPLFCLLTGYLNCKRKLVPGYAKKIVPLLTTYVIACLMALMALVVLRGREYTLLDGILQILAISKGAIGYGWYVEMYIGLFLLIPFLNRLYDGLETRQEKKMLLGALMFLTVLPCEFNFLDEIFPEFFEKYCRMAHFQEIIPSSWKSLYPLTYYFMGAYIREYEIRLPKRKNILLLLLGVVGFGLLEFSYSRGGTFKWINGSEWGSLQNTVNSVLLFLLLLGLDLSRLPEWMVRVLNRISVLSFGIYLCSYLSDEVVYGVLGKFQLPFQQVLPYFPVVVLASFLLAAVLSQAAEWARLLLFWGAGKLRQITVAHTK